MNILIAPNSMKGSLSAFQFADVVGQAFQDVGPSCFKIRKLPVADGGDETVNVLMKALNLEVIEVNVFDPLGRPVQAWYGYANGVAVIEMANASGLKLLKTNELNPMKTSSFGTGQVILDAIHKGAKKIYVGIGGSATVDGGMGMLEALGILFFDGEGKTLNGNGENTGKIRLIDSSNCLLQSEIKVFVISDVDNCLLGECGAARVFGPQKGATTEMVEALEINLMNYADVIRAYNGKEVTTLKGGGAAGGISIAFSAFLNAPIMAGADFIMDIISLDESIKWADLVITGEGRIDNQTLMNKAPYVVAQRAKKYGKPVIALVGSVSLTDGNVFDGVFSIINQPCNLDYAITNADKLLYNLAKELACFIIAINGSIHI
jgi:glycerate kinase